MLFGRLVDTLDHKKSARAVWGFSTDACIISSVRKCLSHLFACLVGADYTYQALLFCGPYGITVAVSLSNRVNRCHPPRCETTPATSVAGGPVMPLLSRIVRKSIMG